MLAFFGIFTLFGYSYMNDIKEQKGRKSRKIFPSSLPTNYEIMANRRWGVDRLAAHDPAFEKYTHKKERAHAQHPPHRTRVMNLLVRLSPAFEQRCLKAEAMAHH